MCFFQVNVVLIFLFGFFQINLVNAQMLAKHDLATLKDGGDESGSIFIGFLFR